MKYWLLLSIVVASESFAQSQTTDSNYVAGEIYVKLKPSAIKFAPNANSALVNVAQELPALQNTMQKYKYNKAERSFFFSMFQKLQSIYRIRIADNRMIDKFIAELQKNPNVEYAEKIPLMRTHTMNTPNDPSVNILWHLNKIKAFEATDIAPFKVPVAIGIVDEFIQVDHPDLAQNVAYSQDLANGDMDTRPDITNQYHGTHIAGIVGATTNNKLGISSVGANRVKIVGLNATPYGEYGYLTHHLECVLRAVELEGIRVINLSFGSDSYDETSNLVYQSALDAGIVLVASAGNNYNSALSYPAAYNKVIAVASTNEDDHKSDFSNFGNWIDIAAPGENIYSTMPFSKYGFDSGTSMSSPLVAGAIGFLFTIRPEMTADSVESLVKNTADDISSLNPDYKLSLGYGRLNLKRAVECINSHSTKANFAINSTSPGNYCTGQTYTLSVPLTSTGSTYQWFKDGVAIPGVTTSNIQINAAGTYTVTVIKDTCPRKSERKAIIFTSCG